MAESLARDSAAAHSFPIGALLGVNGSPRGLIHKGFLPIVQAVGLLITAGLALRIFVFLLTAVYNVYLHPLRSHPGPKLWTATRLTWWYYKWKGTLWLKMLELHTQYGPTVRIAPDEVSYITDTAWKTCYGYGRNNMEKDSLVGFSGTPYVSVRSLLTSPGADHARQRRIMSHGFSDRALKEQEEYLQSCSNQLLERLEAERSKGSVDMVRWWNYATYDVIGELAFGRSFDCLKDGGYHPYVYSIMKGLEASVYAKALSWFKIPYLYHIITPRKLRNSRRGNFDYATSVLADRVNDADAGRKDFFSYILKHNNTEKALSYDELRANATLLIAAGSETTASALAGLTWYLAHDERVQQKLTKEIRAAFDSADDITLEAASKLEYLDQVINEVLRIYSPVPDNLPRFVPPGGEMVDGRFVPAGTRVAVANWAASNSEYNFHKADQFIPERWSKENRAPGSTSPFAKDNHGAWMPFSSGPRACIGRNLAIAELRLFVTKTYFTYDMQLDSRSANWMAGNLSFLLRIKPELYMKLTPAAPQ